MKSLDSRVNRKSGSLTESSGLLPTILDIFSNEGYILWFTPRRREAIIVLKTGSTAKVELYAWWHAMRVAVAFAAAEHAKDLRLRSMLLLLKSSLLKKSSQEQQMKILENAGWDLSTVLLQTSPTKRIHLVAAASAEGVKQGPIG
jgi:hypothetical protein